MRWPASIVTATPGRPASPSLAANHKKNFRTRKKAESWAAQLHGQLQNAHAPLLGGPAKATVGRTLYEYAHLYTPACQLPQRDGLTLREVWKGEGSSGTTAANGVLARGVALNR